jgi:hypothetical protein
MKLLLRHPVWSGLCFEAFLVTLFGFFPVGSCNAPAIGVAVLFLHYPAFLFVGHVLGIGFSLTQYMISAGLMTLVWICGVLGIRRIVRPKEREAAK